MTYEPTQKHNMAAGVGDRPVQARKQFYTAGRIGPPPTRSKRPPVLIVLLIVVIAGAGAAWYLKRSVSHELTVPPPATMNMTDTSATITWGTDKPLSSQVKYGTTTEYGLLSIFNAAPTTSHSITLTGLTPGTTYNYVTLSADSAGQVTTSPDGTFTTTGTHANSAIGAVAVKVINSTTATIVWTTDQPSTSQVEYGDSPAYGSLSAFNASPVTSHSVTLTALKPGTTYNYAALSTNSIGQITTSPNATFTTSALAGAPVVTNAKAINIMNNSATIIWNTDQPSTSQVEYGTTAAHGYLSSFSPASVTSHTLILTGLAPGTTYYYAAMSTNSTGQVGKSEASTFATVNATGTPTISSVKVTGIEGSAATITWTTDRPSASQVQFGPTPDYGSLSTYNPALVTAHSITLNTLTPGSTYNYSAMSTSASGQIGKSDNFTFTAAAGPPVIKQIGATHITANSVTITWTTDQPSTSQVKFGSTTLLYSLTHRHRKPYDQESARDSALVRSHAVTVKDLAPGTTYNYAVVSGNSGGIENLSSNQKFETTGQ
jgi:hypothetical protein